jgi:hypothetical protein
VTRPLRIALGLALAVLGAAAMLVLVPIVVAFRLLRGLARLAADTVRRDGER